MSGQTLEFPHLTNTESVRQEATQAYGQLDNAASFIQAHKASRDPNVEAAALKKVNVEETEKVKEDLSLAQEKIDAEYGKGFTVVDAVVRGEALSVVAEAPDGRTVHLVAGWTDKWRPVVPSAAERSERTNAAAEMARGRLGAEARAEVERLVQAGLEKAMEKVGGLLSDKQEEVDQIRAEAVEEAVADEEKGDNGSAETPKGAKADGSAGAWPRRKDALTKIAKKHGVEVSNADKVDEMIGKLEAAGVEPPAED